MTPREVCDLIMQGRAEIRPVNAVEVARQNEQRPASVKVYVSDELVKALKGDPLRRPQVFVVIVPPEDLIVKPRIVLPPGVRP